MGPWQASKHMVAVARARVFILKGYHRVSAATRADVIILVLT